MIDDRPQRIGYQGIAGAYSEEAAGHYAPSMEAIGYSTFDAVFEALDKKDIDLAMLPLENSTAGVVQRVSDLLWEYDNVTINDEVILPVQHHLLGREEPVTQALSHPQALAQCARWLATRNIEPIPFFDTAGAAKEVALKKKAGAAAIAGIRAAEHYGLRVLASHIADVVNNRTRFAVVRCGRTTRPIQVAEPKLSLGVAAAHRPGSLAELLNIFTRHGANLTRLDSRPIPAKPFTYRFYVDAEMKTAERAEALITELGMATPELRSFGAYSRAVPPR